MRRWMMALLVYLAACAPTQVDNQATSAPTITMPAPSVTAVPAVVTPVIPTEITVSAAPSVTAAPTVITPVIPTEVTIGAPPSAAAMQTGTPGIGLQGFVRLQDGTGLANVTICRSYAAYNGVVIATTGPDGSFQAPFAFIPGDEMVAVWALAPGYTFDPTSYSWRHYYGSEQRSLDFTASAAGATAAPPVPCS